MNRITRYGNTQVFGDKSLAQFADRHYKHFPKVDLNFVKYKLWEVFDVTRKAREVLEAEATLLEIDPPLVVIGDIHGHYNDLLRIFTTMGTPPSKRYLFLGDYVDRGQQGVETIILLLTYKVLYPNDVFLLRGNHEDARMNKVYGFRDEVKRRFRSKQLWNAFQACFNLMPVAAVISDRIFCAHGGLSPQLKNLDQIRRIKRPIYDTAYTPGLVNDIMWSDPEVNQTGWEGNPRQISYTFGADVLDEFCSRFDIQLVVRGHQVCQDGYRFFADRKLVTIFSAPNYCNDGDNMGAVMEVSSSLTCSFTFFCPYKFKKAKLPPTPDTIPKK